MPNETPDTFDLELRYQATIDKQKSYLAKLKAAFDGHCDEVGKDTKVKLTGIPEEDEEGRKKILDEEQLLLKKALAELNQEIKRSSAETYKKLEQIDQKRAITEFDLSAELGQIENPKKETLTLKKSS